MPKKPKTLPKSRTFVVSIKKCDHGSWQGSLEWIEGSKKISFRSALELIKLMDSAVTAGNASKDLDQDIDRKGINHHE